jgi:hypothetical protein
MRRRILVLSLLLAFAAHAAQGNPINAKDVSVSRAMSSTFKKAAGRRPAKDPGLILGLAPEGQPPKTGKTFLTS